MKFDAIIIPTGIHPLNSHRKSCVVFILSFGLPKLLVFIFLLSTTNNLLIVAPDHTSYYPTHHTVKKTNRRTNTISRYAMDVDDSASTEEFVVGSTVTISGLTSDRGKRLNGGHAMVVQNPVTADGTTRYPVWVYALASNNGDGYTILSTPETVSVKGSNLQLDIGYDDSPQRLQWTEKARKHNQTPLRMARDLAASMIQNVRSEDLVDSNTSIKDVPQSITNQHTDNFGTPEQQRTSPVQEHFWTPRQIEIHVVSSSESESRDRSSPSADGRTSTASHNFLVPSNSVGSVQESHNAEQSIYQPNNHEVISSSMDYGLAIKEGNTPSAAVLFDDPVPKHDDLAMKKVSTYDATPIQEISRKRPRVLDGFVELTELEYQGKYRDNFPSTQAPDHSLEEDETKRNIPGANSVEESNHKQESYKEPPLLANRLFWKDRFSQKKLRSADMDFFETVDNSNTEELIQTKDENMDSILLDMEPSAAFTLRLNRERDDSTSKAVQDTAFGSALKYCIQGAGSSMPVEVPAPTSFFKEPTIVSPSAMELVVEVKDEAYQEAEVPDDIVVTAQQCLPVIPALSKRYMFQGRPAHRLAVRSVDSIEIIYEFQVDTGPSWIENAGNGAFLTYLGARKRKETREHCQDRPEPIKYLQGIIHDRPISLELKGDGLDACRQNAWNGSEIKYRRVEDDKRMSSGDRASERWDEESHKETDNSDEEEEQQSDPSSMQQQWLTTLPPLFPDQSIAVENSPDQLGLGRGSSLDDYITSDHISFSSEEMGCIDLGLYAPFMRSDKKNQSLSDIKNFIWSGLPSSYQFEFDGTQDVIRNRKKVADITEDITGSPHGIARSNVAMYINETGGDRNLKQSVWANDFGVDGIHYLFHTKNIGEMKKGDTIELLISYSESYDDVRSRQGYGQNDSIKSDAHLPTYLERQFVERFNMTEEIINEMADVDIHALCELLMKVEEQVSEVVDAFFQDMKERGSSEKIPSSQLLIALRRIHWLKPILEHKASNMVGKWGNDASWQHVLNHCMGSVKLLGRKDWPEILNLLEDFSNQGEALKLLWDSVRREIIDEMCYKIHPHLKLPCSEDVFCSLAINLIYDLSLSVAKNEWRWGRAQRLDFLFEAFMQLAARATADIRHPVDVSKLTLAHNCWKRYSLENRSMLKDQPEGTRCILTRRVGEEGDLGNDDPEPLVVLDEMIGNPKLLSVVHLDFYLCRQVIFVVDAFAKRYLADMPSYSLEVLCKHCSICVHKASSYTNRRLHIDSNDVHPFFGSVEYLQYQRGHHLRNPAESTAAPSIPYAHTAFPSQLKKPKKQTVNKLIFWRIVWVSLQELGWTMDRGNRPGDWYICPPGVVRGQGASPRKDFFDSIPLVRNCLVSDERYCCQPEIKKIVRLFQECEKELQALKSGEKQGFVVKFAQMDDLISYVKNRAGGKICGASLISC
ncbi:hypothetical protein IV203_011762 [Nitzschia inconspicua]|uniref:Uncharacterized protein n=1 Tax=Nitzschia inconspicua TaxID=303405 RepID=A0A9K3PJ53_9STRA|nr:hypothetical protein IV203_011762 [Nitzschia inconspicua]